MWDCMVWFLREKSGVLTGSARSLVARDEWMIEHPFCFVNNVDARFIHMPGWTESKPAALVYYYGVDMAGAVCDGQAAMLEGRC